MPLGHLTFGTLDEDLTPAELAARAKLKFDGIMYLLGCIQVLFNEHQLLNATQQLKRLRTAVEDLYVFLGGSAGKASAIRRQHRVFVPTTKDKAVKLAITAGQTVASISKPLADGDINLALMQMERSLELLGQLILSVGAMR